jgi:hypothetical protein
MPAVKRENEELQNSVRLPVAQMMFESLSGEASRCVTACSG